MAYLIEYGNEGTDIRRLQLFLMSKMGADLSPDGHYGPNTRNAIFSFQRDRGLRMTGVVDRATYEALESEGLILRGAPTPDAKPENGPTSRRTSPSQPLHGPRRHSAALNIATPCLPTIRSTSRS
jgi:peptidoglycan hydrolase-like protein with peptidoglycan-binding domain